MAVTTKPCAYCSSDIATSATLCPICKSFQNRFRNTLTFVAGLTGFVALIASAILFVATQTANLYKIASWNDQLLVIELVTGRATSATFSNVGDGAVFVSDVVILWNRTSIGRPIRKTIMPGEFLTFAIATDMPSKPLQYLSNETGVPSPEVIQQAAFLDDKKCVVPVFFSEQHTAVETMNKSFAQDGKQLMLDKAEGRLIYISGHDGEKHSDTFNLVVAFQRNPEGVCSQ